MRGRGVYGAWRIVWVGQARARATCNDQRERMQWREFRVGGMGVCLGVSEARAWVHVAQAVEYRTFILCASPLPFPAHPYASELRRPPLGSSDVARDRAARSASGLGRHYSIWKGLYGPYAALRLATCHRATGPPLPPSKDDDPMPLSLVLGI